jgi:hypothetical protein
MNPDSYSDAERLLVAGASPEFATVMLAEPSDHPDVDRHSVKELVRKHDDPERVRERGGDFAGNLWDGNVAEAFFHADGNNVRLLLDTFGPAYLWAAGVSIGAGPVHFRRVLYEKTERYRPDLIDEIGPKPPRE